MTEPASRCKSQKIAAGAWPKNLPPPIVEIESGDKENMTAIGEFSSDRKTRFDDMRRELVQRLA
jgi:hypothetical protein